MQTVLLVAALGMVVVRMGYHGMAVHPLWI
jgi:hypothetical protein